MSNTPYVAEAAFPETQFLVPDWGLEVGYGLGTGPPTYVRSLADQCDKLSFSRLFILWSGTKNTATVPSWRQGVGGGGKNHKKDASQKRWVSSFLPLRG